MTTFAKRTAILVLCGSLSVFGGTKLSKAVIADNLNDVKECIKSGESVNEIDKWGWTPLMWAVYNRNLVMTDYLLANGADPNIQAEKAYGSLTKGATALVIAGYYGLEDQAESLVNKGAKVGITDGNGKTAMDYAKQYEFTGVASILARKGGTSSGSTKSAASSDSSTTKIDLGKGVDGTALGKVYSKVVLEEFTTTKEIAKDYLSSVVDCQTSALGVLSERKGFEKASLKTDGQALDRSTLLVKVEVTELRITSSAARFWAGAMAGSSYVHARVKLVDGATGKVEREQLLTTENNAWGASWTGGSSDRSIPKDMGAIIAGYVITVAGKK